MEQKKTLQAYIGTSLHQERDYIALYIGHNDKTRDLQVHTFSTVTTISRMRCRRADRAE